MKNDSIKKIHFSLIKVKRVLISSDDDGGNGYFLLRAIYLEDGLSLCCWFDSGGGRIADPPPIVPSG